MPSYTLPPVPIFYYETEKRKPIEPFIVIHRIPPVDNYACPTCGMIFEANKAYGYCCPNINCPTQPKAT